MKKLLSIFIFILLFAKGFSPAQAAFSGGGNWTVQFGASSQVHEAEELVIDGNYAYLVGRNFATFADAAIDFDPTGGTDNHTARAWVTKYHLDGTYQWACALAGGAATVGPELFGIASDSSGNIIVSGNYQGASVSVEDGNGAPTTTNNTSASTTNGLILKYNSSGVLQWSKNLEANDVNGETASILLSRIAVR